MACATTTTILQDIVPTTMLSLQHPVHAPMRTAPSSNVPHHHHRASTSASSLHRSSSPPRRAPSQITTPVSVAPRPLLSSPVSPAIAPTIDISTFPTSDLLRLLASLLQRVATTNDGLRSHQPTIPPQSSHVPLVSGETPLFSSLTTAAKQSLSTPSSPLSFHARNVPTISIESYLLRILKYCPTTNEVFLSLLVYFDRMALLGDGIRNEFAAAVPLGQDYPNNGGGLVIDSYNVHRLIIAGVTVASKFFSDVFYTNSRYAKVQIFYTRAHPVSPNVLRSAAYPNQSLTNWNCSSFYSTTFALSFH